MSLQSSHCDLYIDGEVQIGPVKDFNRKAKPGTPVKKGGDNDDERRKGGKQSLRLGTSRKGRAAEASNRRGSLKRRDRRSEKERKAEAAIERKTIQLPEYVIFLYLSLMFLLNHHHSNPVKPFSRHPFRGSLTVLELAELIDEKPIALIKFLMSDLGIMASLTRSLDPQTINAVIDGYGLIIAGSEDDDEDDDYEYVLHK